MRRAVLPGSFDPLTVAHLAIADAAHSQLTLDYIDLVISVDPLGKDGRTQASAEERLDAIRSAAHGREWLRGLATEHRLLADIAEGYDFLIVGGDKAAQLLDPTFYDSEELMESALRGLPTLVLAPRPGGVAPDDAVVLELPDWVAAVSSTAVRSGRIEWKA